MQYESSVLLCLSVLLGVRISSSAVAAWGLFSQVNRKVNEPCASLMAHVLGSEKWESGFVVLGHV